MGSRATPRIVYVLPEYDENTGSHFFHLYELVRRAAGVLDLLVVIEGARGDPRGLAASYYRQRFSWPPLRFLELLAVLIRERLRGCRNFYVHYSFYGAITAWSVARTLGGRVFYWNSGEPWKYARPRLEETVFRFILRHTILVTNPPGLAEEYRQRYRLRPDRIRILPHFIEVARFQAPGTREQARPKLGLREDAKIVLFVHRLSRRKGAHLLSEIAAAVIKLERRAMFIVVGDGPEKKNLESRIKNQGLEPYVRLVGEVPQRDIVPYFHAADVFLLPSEEEGFPHVLLEAAAAGVPFVAADVGGIREMLPPALNHWLAPSGDVGIFSSKLLELLVLPQSDLERVAPAVQVWVQQYDIDAVLSGFVGLFRS